MNELAIHTLIHRQYQVLDHSGQLPFSIVFDLCRHASTDTESRPLLLATRESAFDAPYALANKRLYLIVEDADVEEADLRQETALAVEKLSQFETKSTYLSLSSPVNRSGRWKPAIVTCQYQVDPRSELGALSLQTKKIIDYTLGSGIGWYRLYRCSKVLEHSSTTYAYVCSKTRVLEVEQKGNVQQLGFPRGHPP